MYMMTHLSERVAGACNPVNRITEKATDFEHRFIF